MKALSLLTAVLALGFTLATADAEAAKRIGAGKSSGMQRQATVPDKSTATAPAQATAQSAVKERWLRQLRQNFLVLSGNSAVKSYPRARVLLFNQARAHAPVGNSVQHQAAFP